MGVSGPLKVLDKLTQVLPDDTALQVSSSKVPNSFSLGKRGTLRLCCSNWAMCRVSKACVHLRHDPPWQRR